MINYTGDGLTIKINTELTFVNNWLTFQLWKTCSHYIPDAKIVVFAKRNPNYGIFKWPMRVGIKLNTYSGDINLISEKNTIILPSYSAAIDIIQPNLGPSNIQDDLSTTFVNFENGFSNFIMSEWINKDDEIPFFNAIRNFKTENTNVNEMRLLKQWENFGKTFMTLL